MVWNKFEKMKIEVGTLSWMPYKVGKAFILC